MCRGGGRSLYTKPTWDNWLAYKCGNIQCQKILKKEKRLSWRQLCSNFTAKTPTAEIWQFVRSYKTKSFLSEIAADQASFDNSQDALNKLCPPSCLHYSFSWWVITRRCYFSKSFLLGWWLFFSRRIRNHRNFLQKEFVPWLKLDRLQHHQRFPFYHSIDSPKYL